MGNDNDAQWNGVEMMTKIFVVGDIHGIYSKFIRLMEKVRPDYSKDDTIIFLGDYIDRGRSGYKVLKYLYHWQQRDSHVICLEGNHEYMLKEFFKKYRLHDAESLAKLHYPYYDSWLNGNAGMLTMKSIAAALKHNDAEVFDVLAWCFELPFYYRLGKINFSHAGYNTFAVEEHRFSDEFDAVWTRDEFLRFYKGPEHWYIGHTPTQLLRRYLNNEDKDKANSMTNMPVTFGNITDMDTGSFIRSAKGKYAVGKISCLEITEGKLYQD